MVIERVVLTPTRGVGESRMNPLRPPVDSAITIECYVRTSSLVAPTNETVAALREFEQQGVIADLTVEAWPDEIVLGDEDEPATVEQYRRFKAWANREDVSLHPAFAVRKRTTLVGDRTEAVLTLPMVCLAVYVDGTLETVAPNQSKYTVNDVLADLEELDPPPALSPPTDTSSSSSARVTAPAGTPERCPGCEEPLMTGQGLYTCPTCSWTGIVRASAGASVRPETVSPDQLAPVTEEPADTDLHRRRPDPPA